MSFSTKLADAEGVGAGLGVGVGDGVGVAVGVGVGVGVAVGVGVGVIEGVGDGVGNDPPSRQAKYLQAVRYDSSYSFALYQASPRKPSTPVNVLSKTSSPHCLNRASPLSA